MKHGWFPSKEDSFMKRFPRVPVFLAFFLVFSLLCVSSCCGQLFNKKKRKAVKAGSYEAFAAEMAKRPCVPPPPANKAAFDRYVQEGWDNPFGVDYVFIQGPRARNADFVYDFAGVMGLRWVNFSRIQWSIIEKKPPRKGKHNYNWSALDDGVRKWQYFGVHALMTLFSHNKWATATPSGKENVYLTGVLKPLKNVADYLPKPEHMQDYRDYVTALVERYDGDGVDDMPGLRFPILHYQFGNEYYNELFWAGSVEEFKIYQKESALAARKANPNVKIVLSGVTFEEFSGFYEEKLPTKTSTFIRTHKKTGKKKGMVQHVQRKHAFGRKSISFCDYYDILDVRWPYYGAVKEGERKLKQAGCKGKEIWSAEVYSHFPLILKETMASAFLAPYPGPPESQKYLKILRNKHSRKFKKVNAWYRGLQAAHLPKQLMASLSAGAKKVIVGYAEDTQSPLAPQLMPVHGLRSHTFQKIWPVSYTYKLSVEKLKGITSCRRLLPTPKGVYVYENVVKGGKKVWIAFYDDLIGQNVDQPLGTKQYALPFAAKSATVTDVITEIDQTTATSRQVRTQKGKLPLLLTEYPVFIEAN